MTNTKKPLKPVTVTVTNGKITREALDAALLASGVNPKYLTKGNQA